MIKCFDKDFGGPSRANDEAMDLGQETGKSRSGEACRRRDGELGEKSFHPEIRSFL